MSYIKYSLTNVCRLDTMASTGPANAGSHAIVTMKGFYLIFNQATDNRYIGKADDIKSRFDGRMTVVNDLGLKAANLKNIDAFYGAVAAFNTPPPVPMVIGPPPPVVHMAAPTFGVGGPGLAPARNPADAAVNACGAPNYLISPVTANVDGYNIDVEALLIRFWLQGMDVGGTMTNLHKTGPFLNPTPTQMDVMVEWGAGVTTKAAAGYQEIQINPNSTF